MNYEYMTAQGFYLGERLAYYADDVLGIANLFNKLRTEDEDISNRRERDYDIRVMILALYSLADSLGKESNAWLEQFDKEDGKTA